jgi:Holliday junction resolvase RusA-like endonuclease
MENMKIEIKPISINTCWQGRRFMTPAYKQWITDMLFLLPKWKTITGNTRIIITLNLKSTVRGDIDNFLKPIIDCLVKKGLIEDDRYIQRLNVVKRKSKVENIEIEIEEL